ncbi:MULTISPECIES: hypothetical protein [Achromobacter]|uniref:hypothetical protein n=1 Tax=Achromobacter TaxID=222 RepID=UPI0006C33191|nr:MULTISPECIES: hypothetical protein [Achromobacter]CUJ71814.1 Uncharacterised protein [Achromobacter sp. 2789STDY5608628]CUJ76931.1 Uncharacterised protein [Achromobacter sp. 2789STDY5608633]
MSFGITVEREISHAKVIFTAMLGTAAEALDTATLLATGTAPAPAKAQAEKKPEAAATAKPSTEKPTPDASGSSGSSSIESKNDGEAAAGNTPAALDYDTDIKPLVLAIAKISREKAEALLQRFGVQSAKALKPDQFADFKVKAQQVIDGSYDPVASDEKALA